MFFPQRWPESLYWSNLVLCNARIQPYSAHCCFEQILHGAARSFQFFLLGLSRVFLQVLRFYHVFSIPFRSQKISGAGGPTKPTKASWLKTRWRPNVAATPKAPVWSVAPKLSRGWQLPAMRGMRARTRICHGDVGSWFYWDSILVGGLEHVLFFHIIIGNNNPNWLIFFKGVETTNQNMI